MAGTFVIGVGGTGIKTLIHVKKQLQDSHQDGKLPPDVQILGIDTRSAPESLTGIGSWHNAQARRQLKEYQGNVSIDANTEYYWLGGNLERWTCGDTAQGERGLDDKEYITRWFDLKYFANHPVRSALLGVNDGAGMFRQIGRLGLFYHLQHGSNSILYTRLSEKLGSIADGIIDVILCGSLAGGTGAALFQDIAYLVKAIGAQLGRSVQVTAMLVLPEAFNWTPHLTVDSTMRARSVAAMREMVRFKTVNDSALGFRMQYVDGTHLVLNARAQGALFNLVYLLEKRAVLPQHATTTNPLDTTIDYGMAPTMAAWIAALCSHTIAEPYRAWVANIAAIEAAGQFQGLVPALCGSFGTYSIVLPLASIIEKWSSDLALDVLGKLVPLTAKGEFDSACVGETLVTAGSVKAGEDWVKNSSHIAQDAGNLGQRDDPKTHPALVQEVIARSVEQWRIVYLDQNSTDGQSKLFEDMTEKKKYFYNFWKRYPWSPIDEGALIKRKAAGNYDGNTEKAATELHNACETKYAELESEWSKTLNGLSDYQFRVFRDESTKFVGEVLNGTNGPMPHSDPVKNRPGSLTWLHSYLLQQSVDLKKAFDVLDDVTKGLEGEIGRMEAEWITGTKNKNPLLVQMKRDEGKQGDYLKKRQEWLVAKRKVFLCTKEKDVVSKMLSWTSYLQKRLYEHATVISTSINNMSNWIAVRRTGIVNEENGATQLNRVREIIKDSTWEDLKYKEYLNPDPNQPDARYQVLSKISWDVREITAGTSSSKPFQAPEPELRLLGFALENDGVLATDRITAQYLNAGDATSLLNEVKHNSIRLLELCRKQFSFVWDRLTIVDYLKHHYNSEQTDLLPQALAKTSAQKCNILLSTTANDPLTRMAYVIAPAGSINDPFLLQVLNQLQLEVNAAAQFNQVLPNTDSTTLTFLVLNSGFAIKSLDAYKMGVQNYLQIPPTAQGIAQSRQLHHIFRSEKEATIYDQLIPGDAPFLVSNRVSMPLEEPGLLDQFLTALALGLIKYVQVPITDQRAGWSFQASIRIVKNVFGQEQETFENWLLNEPGPDVAGYLEAVECYCLRSLDHSRPAKPLADLHALLKDGIPLEIQTKLDAEYMSRWQTGGNGCTARQIAAIQDPNPNTRPVTLRLETTKELWRSLVPAMQQRRNDILNTAPALLAASKTLPDELELLDILLNRIQEFTQV